jgi:beta-D-xylosidase 4
LDFFNWTKFSYSIDIYNISNPNPNPVPLSSATKPNCTVDPLCSNPVCDTSLDPLSRASGLVSVMTFDEKVSNTQDSSPGAPRLGLPAYEWWSEALHGVADSPGVAFQLSGNFSYATSFPQPILMSAAFDDALIQQVGTIVGIEGRAFDNNGFAGLDFWTPNINPFKDPRWGRGQETPGEDPFHIARYVYQLVDGLQNGIAPANPRVAATCKHFAGYDLENWNGYSRNSFNAIISVQDLSEYYLPGFKSCARDAKVEAVMCSYNAVNGIPSCANSYLLDTILRNHWNWNQTGHWVTSDCDAVANIYNPHYYTNSYPAAAADALNAGTNLDCGTTMAEYLPAAAAQGLFENSTLDTALTYLYSSLVRLGWFDEPESPYNSLGWSDVGTPAAQQLANQAAVEGIVLLKNNKGTLPLSQHKQTIALIGPYANATTQLQGNYYGTPEYIRTMIWGAEQAGYNVVYELGTDINTNDTSNFAAAVSAAQGADIIVYAGGIDNSIEAEGNDRNTIVWPGNQLQLIGELSQVGKPLVVLQFGGGQVDDSSLLANDNVNALLWCGYPSQSGGQAVFDILTGKSAPAGRLPITQYPASYTSEIPMTDMSLRPNATTPGRTYRWFTDAVIPFGFGLHYTNFQVSWANPAPGHYKTASLVAASGSGYKDTSLFDTFTVLVKNTGKVTSDYVALLFASTENAGPKPYPLKTLVGYTRAAAIRPGETRSVQIAVTLGSIARTDSNGNLVLYPGSYTLEVDVGAGYPTASFTVNGPSEVLDSFPQPPSA